jgi:hypothetical protein
MKYAGIKWFNANRLPPLAYDHKHVARLGLQRLRSKLQYTNIVYSFLPKEFTLGEGKERKVLTREQMAEMLKSVRSAAARVAKEE